MFGTKYKDIAIIDECMVWESTLPDIDHITIIPTQNAEACVIGFHHVILVYK